MRHSGRVNYVVEVRISGISLVLLSVFGDGRSVEDLLVGGGEWGPPPQLEALSDSNSNPLVGLLGDAGLWGQEVTKAEWG